jgi:hypothetical protein
MMCNQLVAVLTLLAGASSAFQTRPPAASSFQTLMPREPVAFVTRLSSTEEATEVAAPVADALPLATDDTPLVTLEGTGSPAFPTKMVARNLARGGEVKE